MGSLSLSHWLVVLAVIMIVFGAGRLPNAMGELAKGVRNFRNGMREQHAAADALEDQRIEAQPADQGRG